MWIQTAPRDNNFCSAWLNCLSFGAHLSCQAMLQIPCLPLCVGVQPQCAGPSQFDGPSSGPQCTSLVSVILTTVNINIFFIINVVIIFFFIINAIIILRRINSSGINIIVDMSSSYSSTMNGANVSVTIPMTLTNDNWRMTMMVTMTVTQMSLRLWHN